MRATTTSTPMDLLHRTFFGAFRGHDGELCTEQPLRSELLSVDQLNQHAMALAGSHHIDPRPGRDRLLPRLAENQVALDEAYKLVAADAGEGQRVVPAANWLLDNFYFIETQIRTARRHLPREYSRELPRLASGPLAGYPRVYSMALELISHADGRVDAANLSRFVASYQTLVTLKLGELWAIPIMLRLALIESLRRVAIRIAAGRRDLDLASLWADRMLEVAEKEPGNLVVVLADMIRDQPALTSAFVSEIARRLRGHGPALALPMSWLEQRLNETDQTVEQLIQLENHNQTVDQVSISNGIGSLRLLSATDWPEFVETMSSVEGVLREDPAGVYGRMDFATRDRYRHVVEAIARRSSRSEDDIARQSVRLARDRIDDSGGDPRQAHVGYYLIDRGRAALERAVGVRASLGTMLRRAGRHFPFPLYTSALLGLAAVFTAMILFPAARRGVGGWGVLLLTTPALLCAAHLSVSTIHWLIGMTIAPRTLPRIDFAHGIPPEYRTMVVVPTMLTSPTAVRALVESLEVCFLANRDDRLHFGLLTDFRDASQENLPGDAELVALAKAEIEALNRKYAADRPDGFFLFHRPRFWNPQEGVWMGWERKRGKLTELNALLRGRAEHRFSVVAGAVEILPQVKFVITLDTDTQLPRGAAGQLAGTMAHPLNKPRWDAALGRVVEGYSILQPRVGVTLPSAGQSWFSRIFAAEAGMDPYTRAVSDVYQDVFGEGSYIGKGIYDVDAFGQALDGRLPENRILSHDLLEGAYARAGLVSDVVLLEDHPSRYLADAGRRHRWIRGDWQIAAWVLPRVPSGHGGREASRLSALSRWKLLDNLRRSLTPVGLLALLLIGWMWPGLPLLCTLIVVGIVFSPVGFPAMQGLLRKPPDLPTALHLRALGHSAARQSAQSLFTLACLPQDAYSNLDAIIRTAVRVLFTGRGLLEWQTARDSERNAGGRLSALFKSMWVGPLLAIVAAMAVGLGRPEALPIAGPILALWLSSPVLAWLLSRPIQSRQPRLTAEDRAFLRKTARRTWRFFETFVGPADHHLPPDNFQEHPAAEVAHRTSPTNMGLALLSNLAACDFGFISVRTLLERSAAGLATMEKLERYRGHCYNWYDTQTLRPLAPRYVSSVDSGNLAGHLLTLSPGLQELAHAAVVPARALEGLTDTALVLLEVAEAESELPEGLHFLARVERLREELEVPPQTCVDLHVRLERLVRAGADLVALSAGSGEEVKWWVQALERQCRDLLDDLVELAPWCRMSWSAPLGQQGLAGRRQGPDELRQALRELQGIPTLEGVANLESTLGSLLDRVLSDPDEHGLTAGSEHHAWLVQLRRCVREAAGRAAERLGQIQTLVLQCEEMADCDYDFLYDSSRHLLSIGFNVELHRADPGFYDLLASEARLGSFVAIAQGKLPQEHWFSLGRLLTEAGHDHPLLSWSGSMFEYLMPLLVMPTFENTLLDRTYRAVVKRQIEYGRQQRTPWGMTESGYNATDAHLIYQYHTFGVPGLGLKRGLADDLVIAPYASMLALMVLPEPACANLRRLAEAGLLGRHGFYEAVDFTSSRVPRGQGSVIVRSFMAHHQGMSFLSLAHLLLDRPMQRRFASGPPIKATELLLQERVPNVAPLLPHDREVAGVSWKTSEVEDLFRVFTSPQTASPEAHLLSNGRYHVMVSAAGGGYSRWRDLAVTRWREDPTRDCWGSFCYLRDLENGAFWSVAHQPTRTSAQAYEAVFSQAQVEFRRRDHGLETYTRITVSPEDDIELRRVHITNRGHTRRTVELTSYAEAVLAQPATDATHPAFSKLFIQTELLRSQQAVLCTRRASSSGEHPPWMLHLAIVHGPSARPVSYETDRDRFIGRGRTLEDPAAMHVPSLSDGFGSVLDPIVAIRTTVTVDPDETVQVDFITGMAESREAALLLIEDYQDPKMMDRVFDLAWTHSQIVARQLGVSENDAQLYSRLAGAVLYAKPRHRAAPNVIAKNRRGQSGLWGYGISGDLPIVLLRIADQSNLALVAQLTQAHAYWRAKGLLVDLVILNEDQSGYRQNLQDQIMGLISGGSDAQPVERPGGVFVRRSEQISDEDEALVQAVARVVITDTAGTLAEQLTRRQRPEPAVAMLIPSRNPAGQAALPAAPPDRDLIFFNRLGGFTPDGREYVITTTAASVTPAPWVNVLANHEFGTVVSESGGGYTWAENAHEFRLTPWHNDPVTDAAGEAFYIRDEETGRFWSPAPLPARGAMPYTTRHGFGYTVFEYAQDGIASEMWTYVATDGPVKLWRVTLRNSSGRTRRLSLTGFVEWVLGEQQTKNAMHIVTELDRRSGAILARNPYNSEFPGRIAFFAVSGSQRTATGSRREFLGRNGTLADPAAMSRSGLSGKVGPALDPCAALQTACELGDGQVREFVFVLGAGRDAEAAQQLIARFRDLGGAREALDRVWDYWGRTLGAVHVETPDPAVNVLVNGWLLYQTLACRIWARSGFYQSGGAIGFRDQLQDNMALVHAEPHRLREHLLTCAAHQFREGDVQHWWHPPLHRGVRTRISDDYLWLPYAACRYIACVGDTGVLDERVHFLEGRPLRAEEDSYYDMPRRSEESATLYDHCVRAIQNGLKFGEHGLPLMGSGDWNDGMNLVGALGKGESVWLAFFLHDVLKQFTGLARARGDAAFAETCATTAETLRQAIERHAWDGQWYRRAYFDDGLPLGSAENPECQIDSISQSWAVLSGAADQLRSRAGLAAVDSRLVRGQAKLIQLLDPPFDKSPLDPGYIKGYIPGVRENGGQYTHAAIWTAMAFAALGESTRAWELFALINPISHGSSPAAVRTYRVEPYVVAADVYSNPQHVGRGGWTWYTGSAGWMYRLLTESLLGLRLEVDHLRVEPLLPSSWQSYKIHYRFRETAYHITIENRGGPIATRVVLDGTECPQGAVPLVDDRREHEVSVEMG